MNVQDVKIEYGSDHANVYRPGQTNQGQDGSLHERFVFLMAVANEAYLTSCKSDTSVEALRSRLSVIHNAVLDLGPLVETAKNLKYFGPDYRIVTCKSKLSIGPTGAPL